MRPRRIQEKFCRVLTSYRCRQVTFPREDSVMPVVPKLCREKGGEKIKRGMALLHLDRLGFAGLGNFTLLKLQIFRHNFFWNKVSLTN